MSKKIYFLLNSLKGGGAEKQTLFVANHILPEKMILMENAIDFEVPENLKIEIIQNANKKGNIMVKIIAMIYGLIKLPNWIEKDSTVLSVIEYANLLNVWSKKFIKHTAIINTQTTLTSFFSKGLHKFIGKLISKTYPHADSIVVNSFGIKHDMIKNFGIPEHKIHIIPNGYDVQNLIDNGEIPLTVEEQKIFDNPVWVMVGRMDYNKGYGYLIDAFARAKSEIKNVKLFFLGDGFEHDVFVNMATERGLNCFVKKQNMNLNQDYDVYFWGFHINPYKFISKAKWFVFTSVVEGMPNVLLESMILGTPCISADCRYGPREILQPSSNPVFETKERENAEFGILMPVFDIEDKNLQNTYNQACSEKWKMVLIDLAQDEELYEFYKQKGIQRSADFSTEKIIPLWRKILA